jgi:heat shock protein HslJ
MSGLPAAKSVVSVAALALAACQSVPDAVSVACARGRPGPIEGEWMLDRIDGVPWRATRATLIAEPQGFAGSLACNGYGTAEPEEGGPHYAVARGRLAIEGDLVTTLAACLAPQAMAFEAAFLSILDGEPHVAINDDRLCLYTDDGYSLEFVKAETAS